MEVRHLKPMFDLGQLGIMPFSPRDEDSIMESIKNSDVVINMIGKHYETKHIVPTRREDGELSRVNYDFDETHVEIPRTLARLCKEAGVENFIHVSALSADANSESKWSRTKAAGEIAVREEFSDAIIVRPATAFGWEDRFLNSVAEVTERLPFTPLLFGGETLVQPVFATDVGKALFQIVQRAEEFRGDTFQLAGPAEYTYKEVAEFVQDVTTVKKPLVDVPEFAAMAAGRFLDETIAPLLTPDQVIMMKEDCVLKEDRSLKTFADLGMEPSSMDKYAFDFLHRFRPGGHFTQVQGYH
jgi:NADH dehydrogenase (ubiquinone) 1 alpha subcomplex subunit 9